MGCFSGRDANDAFITQKELTLQILQCTVADIKSGFICLNEGEFIEKSKIILGFQNMHNAFTSILTKSEIIMQVFEKFIFPFKVEGSEIYYYKQLLIALFVNSKSTTAEKAASIIQLLFRDKEELTQADSVYIFKQLFLSVMSYSFSLMDKYGQEQKDFDKPKTKEEEEKIIESEPTLLLAIGQNLANVIGQSMIEKDQTMKVEEFVEKCQTYIPDRFYRDIFVPRLLRTLAYRDYENQDLVDKEADEKRKKLKEEKEKKEQEAKEKKEKEKKEEQERKAKEEQEKKDKEEQEKKDKEEKEKKDKEDKQKQAK